MEPYSIEEFTQKIKKSIQVLLFLYEAKTGIKSKASNIHPHVHDKGADVYFELEVPFETLDPDIGSFTFTLNKVDDVTIEFFNKIVLTPKADFIYAKNKQLEDHDDMVGLFMSVDYDWSGHEGQKNSKVRFGFEYYLYYDEYDQYYG